MELTQFFGTRVMLLVLTSEVALVARAIHFQPRGWGFESQMEQSGRRMQLLTPWDRDLEGDDIKKKEEEEDHVIDVFPRI